MKETPPRVRLKISKWHVVAIVVLAVVFAFFSKYPWWLYLIPLFTVVFFWYWVVLLCVSCLLIKELRDTQKRTGRYGIKLFLVGATACGVIGWGVGYFKERFEGQGMQAGRRALWANAELFHGSDAFWAKVQPLIDDADSISEYTSLLCAANSAAVGVAISPMLLWLIQGYRNKVQRTRSRVDQ